MNINNQFDQQNNVEEVTNNKKKLSTSTIIFGIVFFLVILLIVILTVLRVMNHANKTNNINDDNNTQNTKINNKGEKNLDINSGIVQTLFDYVNVDLVSNEWKRESNKTIDVNSISYSDKFKITVDSIISDSFDVKCLELYDEIISSFRNEELVNIKCGDLNRVDTYNSLLGKWSSDGDNSAFATIIKEDDIKKKMHTIFGGDYYERKNSIVDGSKQYRFINSINGYVLLNVDNNETRSTVKESLVSAKKDDNSIVLFVIATDISNNKIKYSYRYIFKYNVNDESYYFDSLEIKDSK